MKNIQMLNESFESEKLQKLIEKKIRELKREKPDWVQKNLQGEIMFLKNEILPIVLRSTTLLYDEIVKYVVTKIREAIDNECNDIVFVLNLSQQSNEVRRIGTCIPEGGAGIELAADFAQKIEEVSL